MALCCVGCDNAPVTASNQFPQKFSRNYLKWPKLWKASPNSSRMAVCRLLPCVRMSTCDFSCLCLHGFTHRAVTIPHGFTMCFRPHTLRHHGFADKKIRDSVQLACILLVFHLFDCSVGVWCLQAMAAVPSLLRKLKHPIPELDLLKLWHAVFYCTLHST